MTSPASFLGRYVAGRLAPTVAPSPSATPADSDTWHPARLIPTAGIRGQEEQEKRATSSLLAVMRAVPEFGHALLKELGAPKSPVIQTFPEGRFKDAAGQNGNPHRASGRRPREKTWT